MHATELASSPIDALARRGWVWFWLALIVICSALPGALRLPVLDRDEARFAQASVQMVETGDYIQIRLQDEARNKKPIGIYWAQAASIALFSDTEARQIWVYRLPSLFAGMAVAWACFWAGTGLVGRRAAFLGAGLLAASMMLTTEAQIAKTDAALVAAITLAMAAAAKLQAGSVHSVRLAILFWASLAASVLIKGPIGPIIILPALLAFAVFNRRDHRLGVLLDLRGIAAFAALVLPWFVAITITTEGRFFVDAVGTDMSDKLTGGGEHGGMPPGLHLLLLPILIFPVTLALLPGAQWAMRAWQGEPERRRAIQFLICWILPGWLVFEVTTVKLVHYTLPLYPPIALLAGAGLVWLATEKRRAPISAALIACTGALWAFLLTPHAMTMLAVDGAGRFGGNAEAVIALWETSGLTGHTTGGLWLGLCVLFFSIGAGICLILRRVSLAWAFSLAAALIVGVGLRGWVLPQQGWVQPSTQAAQLLRSACDDPADRPVCEGWGPVSIYGFTEPSLVFLLGTHTRLQTSAETVGGFGAYLFNMETDLGRTAMARLDDWLAGQSEPVCTTTLPTEPPIPLPLINPANGKPVQWIALAVAAGPCDGL